jgi:hypothetical protein
MCLLFWLPSVHSALVLCGGAPVLLGRTRSSRVRHRLLLVEFGAFCVYVSFLVGLADLITHALLLSVHSVPFPTLLDAIVFVSGSITGMR